MSRGLQAGGRGCRVEGGPCKDLGECPRQAPGQGPAEGWAGARWTLQDTASPLGISVMTGSEVAAMRF